MATLAFALPCLPGGDEFLRNFSLDLNGSRNEEFEGFNSRLGLKKHNCYLMQTPQGPLAIVYLESDDMLGAFQKLAISDHPFDVWFRDQAAQVHGVDFAKPFPAPLPEMVFESGRG